MAGDPSIDVLVPTVGRTEELRQLLESLVGQRPVRRVIVVDQNPDDRLVPLVERFGTELSLVHVREEQRGYAHALNTALRHSSADVIAVADDDCAYPGGLLEQVVSLLAAHPEWDGLAGRAADRDGADTQLRWDSAPGPITRRNIFRRSIGFAMFFRRRVVEAVGDFDETFGPKVLADGNLGGGGADSEYVLRALALGFVLVYDPALVVHHASYAPRFGDRRMMAKGYDYGIEHARLLKEHGYSSLFVLRRAAYVLAASAYFALRGKPGTARFYAAMGLGRLRGLLGKRVS